MKVTAIQTEVVTAGKLSLTELLDAYLPRLADASIVAVSSKVVSLCEKRVVSPSTTSKLALVAAESDRYLAEANAYGFHFSITDNTLIPSAGIDESNGGGDYVLWPADPQATANTIRGHLRQRWGIPRLGVLVTDSTCTPLRRGTIGICLAHSGFEAVKDYVGEPDLFGRPFRVSQASLAGGLAAAAALVMGEGAERTPLCVIEDVPFVRFHEGEPTGQVVEQLHIPPKDDLFGPFLSAVEWTEGGRRRPPISI